MGDETEGHEGSSSQGRRQFSVGEEATKSQVGNRERSRNEDVQRRRNHSEEKTDDRTIGSIYLLAIHREYLFVERSPRSRRRSTIGGEEEGKCRFLHIHNGCERQRTRNRGLERC